MKKIILLLILPFVTLMAIDFTMTRDGLIAPSSIDNSLEDATAPVISNTTTPVTSSTTATIAATSGTNPYLEPINLPKCDAENLEVQFIRSNADWSTINSSTKRIFCVSPGDYTSLGNIKLTTSGTNEKRRYIILDNGNDLHPGKLNKSQLANLALDFQSASYWVIDRAASFDVGFTHSFLVGKNSTHNIFNKIFTQDIFHTMWIRDKAHNNTIQNSRFDGITVKGAEADLSTINIMEWGDSVKDLNVYGTKIINNEFINVKASRCNRFPAEHLPSGIAQKAHFNGTIFDSNTIETTDSVRTDCNGNFDPNGECVGLEAGGIAFKGGSSDVNNPIIVSNNHMWGSRRSDPTYENLSGGGIFSIVYMGAENVKFNNNVVFDGTDGIGFADRYDAEYGSKNIEIKNSLLYNLTKRVLVLSQGVNNIVKDNVIINTGGDWAEIWSNDNFYCGNNTVINPGGTNVLMTGYSPEGMSTNQVFQTAIQAGYTEDYSFTTDKFTNNPRVITLENAVKSE